MPAPVLARIMDAGLEHLDAVVVAVGHHDAAVEGRYGNAVRVGKLAVAAAALAELEVERAVGVEDLDAVVPAVGHDKPIGAVKGDSVHQVSNLPVVYSVAEPRRNDRPVGISHGEAIVSP